MNIISQTIRSIDSRCALIPFITAGYPNLNSTRDALLILDNKGADIIELGIPYSDALADGPVIQEASKIALEQGVYIDQVFNLVKNIYHKLNTPIVIFTYYNPILAKGIICFVKELSLCGAKGLIVPDLPLEEADYLIELCKNFDIELILFISPTSAEKRINAIISKSSGCIYLVSRTGVTGVTEKVENKINKLALDIKNRTDKVIMLGFGISTVDQVANISKWNIDGIVIGSAFVKMMSMKEEIRFLGLSNFCENIKKAICDS